VRPVSDGGFPERHQFLSLISPYVYSGRIRNLMEVSRELSIPYQSLRFRIGRLKEQGITMLPAIEPQKFGLSRVRASFKICGKMNVDSLRAFFGGLNQLAGLHYYARSLMSGLLDCEFLVQISHVRDLARVLHGLEEMKAISNARMMELKWKEVMMMKAHFYDYEKGEWDVDYSTLRIESPHSNLKTADSAKRQLYDHNDLLLIKSLQIDPWRRVSQISSNIGLSRNDASYHLKRHVFRNGQISGFRLKWIGTKNAWSKHGIVGMTLLFRDLNNGPSLRAAMGVVTSLPFTWTHMLTSDDTYLAELLIPISHYPDTMRFLSENLQKYNLLPPEVLFLDWSCVSNYTIPYSMHNVERGWTFNADQTLASVMRIIAA
jgi:hypothetical protein